MDQSQSDFESVIVKTSRSCISNMDDEDDYDFPDTESHKVTLSQRSVKQKGVAEIDTLERMYVQENGVKRKNIIGMDNVSPASSQQIDEPKEKTSEKEDSLREDSLREEQIYVRSQIMSETEVLLERKIQSRPMNFNILLLGRADQEMTLFIDRFLNSKYNMGGQVIQEITGSIVLKRVFRDIKGLKLELTFAHIQGYTAQTLEQYTQTAKTYIQTKLTDHASMQEQVYFSSSKDEQDITDKRIHCCLFFLASEPQDNSDWQIMKRIDKIVNIFPIINNRKYSQAKIKEIIIEMKKIKEQSEVSWFTGEKFLSEKYPRKINALNSPFGRVPPFVLRSSEQEDSLQNPSEDFHLLHTLLISYFSDKLILLTCGFQKELEKKRNFQRRHHGVMGPQRQYQRNFEEPHESSCLSTLAWAVPTIILMAIGYGIFRQK